jgi:hypothetical protein
VVQEDMAALRAAEETIKSIVGTDVEVVCAHSADAEQVGYLREKWPDAWVMQHSVNSWNLYFPLDGDENYDLIHIGNTFMCSQDPQVWFDNVLSRCRWLVVQDLVLGWRERDSETSPQTGDYMRYSYKEHRARIENAFDLEKALGDRIKMFVPYERPQNPDLPVDVRRSVGFIMLVKGDLERDVPAPIVEEHVEIKPTKKPSKK